MERSALSAVVIEELGELFMGALREVGPTLGTADFDGVEQQVQALGRRVLGRVVEAAVAERAATLPAVARRSGWWTKRGNGSSKGWWGTMCCGAPTTIVPPASRGRRRSMPRWGW